jgi:hypothetical protein
MELDTKRIEIPIDENLEERLRQLAAEGWGLVPGAKPMAVYSLCRLKEPTAPNIGEPVFGRMLIDDSKILVIPADKKN